MSEIRYDGRVAVITGAAGGLGRSHAHALARRGCRLVLNDVGGGPAGEGADRAPAELLAEEIRTLGVDCIANADDIGTSAGGRAVVAAAIDAFGRLDVVINNAGILRDAAFHKMSDDDWDRIFAVHVRGAFNVTRAAWGHMRDARYGRVLMTTSGAGLWGNFGQTNYSAAKLAQIGMMNTLKLEGAKYGIHVNAIGPVARSRLTETVMPADLLDKLAPQPVSELVAWLCSDACAETGAIYECGGGWYARTWLVQHPGTFCAATDVTAERLRDEVLPRLADHAAAAPLGGSQDAAIAMMSHFSF
jgi:3-hydroxyacyl-CoA dehydrogenase/3a,7a,12a-trihydroxy-5b-cholest-24-enoyl-CoA hydratase